MSDKTELLPCPFCGGEMKLDPGAASFARGPGEVYVTCDCGAMGAGGKTPDEAIAVWNRRATIQPTAAEPVGLVVADDPVHGWHMIALKPWNEIGANVRLYTAPVAPADAVRDARNEQDAARYRFLREQMRFTSGKNEPTTMTLSTSIPAPDHDPHKDWVAERFDASVDVAIDAAMKNETKEPT